MSETLQRPYRIGQWGNSAAVRLPAGALERSSLHPDDVVDIIAQDGEIIIRRRRPRVTMTALLAAFDPAKHRHTLMLDDAPVGTETR
jgi:antitoxin MazE